MCKQLLLAQLDHTHITFSTRYFESVIQVCWPAPSFLLTEFKPTICARLQLANSKRTCKKTLHKPEDENLSRFTGLMKKKKKKAHT